MSEKINQYDVVFNEYFGPGIGKKENGKYCLYSDYELALKRAEAAEAKLEELEKQEPVAWHIYQWRESPKGWGWYLTRAFASEPNNSDGWRSVALFTRPAPAADLAELVPDERTAEYYYENYPQMAFSDVTTRTAEWNACRAAILRNIEGAK